MCKKTPSVMYYNNKIKTTKKSELFRELDDAPITIKEYAFISDVIYGLSIKELASKYKTTPSRISQWKRELFERLHTYEMQPNSLPL